MYPRCSPALALTAIAILTPALVAAAPARVAIHGRVVDAATGAPIAGAVVAAGAGEPAVSDDDGHFVVEGASDVFVYAEGYAPLTAALGADRPHVLALRADGGGEVIEVVATAPDRDPAPGYHLDRDALRTLPAAGGDILRAAQSLPGVARMPYGLGGVVLRGTSPRDSNVYLDGIEVPAAFHFAAVSSFFPSTLLDGMAVVPGGGDASRGRSVGGTIELTSRAPRGDRLRASAELGLLDAQATAEGPTPGGGAIVVGVRRSYIDAVLGAAAEDRLVPRYYDGQLRWDHTVRGGTLTALGFFSDDALVTPGATLASRSGRAALRYRRAWGATALSATASAGWDRLDFTGVFDDGSASDLGRTTRPAALRADVTRDAGWGHVAAGIDAQGARVTSRRDVTLPEGWRERVVADTAYVDLAAWAEARWAIAGGKLAIKPGARVERYGTSGEWVVEPRLLVSHDLGAGITLRETLGVHHQPPAPSDVEMESGQHRRATRGVHGSVGADVALPGGAALAVTAFHVALDRVALSNPDLGPSVRLETTTGTGLGALARELVDEQLATYVFQENVGRGRSRGAELAVQRRGERLSGALAYTLARAERTGDPRREPAWHRYDFDQTHNLSATGSLRLGRWLLGARVRYASGNPQLTPAPVDGALAAPAPPGVRELPAFFSLDLRADRAWRRPWGTISVFVDVQNVTGQDNVEDVMVDQGEVHQMRGLPTFPSFGIAVDM
jgi:hypothetical protein